MACRLEMNPLMIKIFQDGIERYGPRELSPNIIKRLEEATGLDIRAPGFPPEMWTTNPKSPATRWFPPLALPPSELVR
jgi:3-hydroxyisobutyrate dehydrogenase